MRGLRLHPFVAGLSAVHPRVCQHQHAHLQEDDGFNGTFADYMNGKSYVALLQVGESARRLQARLRLRPCARWARCAVPCAAPGLASVAAAARGRNPTHCAYRHARPRPPTQRPRPLP